MVVLYDKDGRPTQSFCSVQKWDRQFVEYLNGGYLAKMYADLDAGEYFDDPANPAPPPEPEPESPDVQELKDILEGVVE